jgi:hypothetical protein
MVSIFIEQKVKTMEITINELKAQVKALEESFKSISVTAAPYEFSSQSTQKTKADKKWKNETSVL